MKKLVYASAFLASLFLVSCGGSESKKEVTATTDAAPSTDTPAPVAINEADWELKDLGATGKDFLIPPFAVKLPKDARVEKDTAGLTNTLHVTFKNGYRLIIQYGERVLREELKLKGEIEGSRRLDIDASKEFNDIKVLGEDANGYTFTSQPMDAGKPVLKPIGHFAYFIGTKTGGYISIKDFPSLSLSTDEEALIYSAENTKKIYAIIAGSAVFK